MTPRIAEATTWDVLVIGGGPAGSCTAGLLAQAGYSVLLVEREKFPRYHIGESLIPGVFPTLERLGLRSRMEEQGWIHKHGGTVRWGRGQDVWNFQFGQAGPYEYVYQVPRAEFDALLLERARELGVRVLEDAKVEEILDDEDRIVGARYTFRGEQQVEEARARFVVDASGQRRLLASQFDLVEWHEDLRNTAVWAYFEGCDRYDGDHAGDVLVEMRRGGWIWFIPLSERLTSVGYVVPNTLVEELGIDVQALFEAEINTSTEVLKMMKDATRTSGFRTMRDWSYTAKRFFGPGWALVGDSAAFVDPLLSTGVALAVRGAGVLADALIATLKDPQAEAKYLQEYENDSRAFLDVILAFVRSFYDQKKSRTEYYKDAQALIDPDSEEEANVDFVKLVSGLGGMSAARLGWAVGFGSDE
jgi:flavin-dependent dehydrogenase